MADVSLKDKVSKGLFWGGLSNSVQQLLGLAFGIVLARILTPADYGMIGMLTVFTTIVNALQEGGFISALTNLKNVNPRDYSSVMWFSTSCSVVCYVILFFCAPLIAYFYDDEALIPLSRFLFLSFVIASLNIAPRAVMFKNLRVKEMTTVSVLALFGSGIVGVTLSLSGFTYWALAWQTMTYTSLTTILSYVFSGWRPQFSFSFGDIRKLIEYGVKIVITNIFSAINNNIFAVLLGKFYSVSDVGDFNQANKWNMMGYQVVSGTINGVAQPIFSILSNNAEQQVHVFRKLLRFTAFISFPAMFGLSFVAKDLIVMTITEKWIVSASILQVLCVWGAFFPISYLFSHLILSRGRSNVYMWITISLCLMQIAAVYLSYPFGLERMLYVFVSINILWIFVWHFYATRNLPIKLWTVVKDIAPYCGLALVSLIIAYMITSRIDNLYIRFVTKILTVMALYCGMLWLAGSKIFRESLSFVKHRQF